VKLRIDWIESPLGILLAAATPAALHLLEFIDDEDMRNTRLDALRARHPDLQAEGEHCGYEPLAQLRVQLTEYFRGERQAFDLPLAYPGTAFQERVWALLLQIPYGDTWSYQELAARAGNFRASRAVGTANGMNPISIVIPCHRVINANGALGGYGGGLWRKRLLLDLERRQGHLEFEHGMNGPG
jgi:O-6-methylguanine DNA methyltransferase